jgi:hypothetical protein
MINLVEKFDKHEKELTDFLMFQKSNYFKSKCFKRLQERYHRLKASNDMNFNGSTQGRSIGSEGNSFQSKVAFPIVKERTMIREAILSQNFRGEPIITVEPASATPMDNAKNAQELLNANFKTTHFRAKAFKIIKKDCAEYGAAVSYSAWREGQKQALKTVDTPMGPDRQLVRTAKKNCWNFPIHILDYFQNPDIADPDDSEYQGHIERINLSKLKVLSDMAPDVYNEKNLKWVIKEAEKAIIEDKDYHAAGDGLENNQQNFPIDRIVMYSTCNIRGNEENENNFYIEIIAGKIVRFQENPHDEDIRPYSTFTFYPRREYWWGNSDAEFVLPHEKFTNLIMSMKADNALRAMQSYIFYEKGSIDTSDWNNRHKNGGMIGVESKNNKNLNQLLYQVQPQDFSLQGTDMMMREIKESQQRLTPRPDFTRAAAQGGIRNSTATAAVILDEQGDVAEAQILENFMFGLKRLAYNNIIIMQQRLGDAFAIRPNMNEAQRILEKKEILGNFDFHIETSLNKNKASELLRLQNILTAIMNFKGSGDPAFQNVDVVPLVRKILKSADIGDVDEYILETPATPMTPDAVPDTALPGQELAGGIGLDIGAMAPADMEGALSAA